MTQSRRFLVCCAIAAMVAMISSPTPALAAGGAPVTFFINLQDGSIRPNTVTVPPLTTVTWRNVGRSPHRVVSDTNAWAAFSLSPGTQKGIELTKVGRYPYHVDGELEGLVVVRVPVAVPAPSPAKEPASACCYSLVVTAYGSIQAVYGPADLPPTPSGWQGFHRPGWMWRAVAIVEKAAGQFHVTGKFTPRVAAEFAEDGEWIFAPGGSINADSPSQHCVRRTSTSLSQGSIDRFLASNFTFEFVAGKINVSLPRPFAGTLSDPCANNGVSTHGTGVGAEYWDGFQGPWSYTGLKPPPETPVSALYPEVFVWIAYNPDPPVINSRHVGPKGDLHEVGGTEDDHVAIEITYFPESQLDVERRDLEKKYPLTSDGFLVRQSH